MLLATNEPQAQETGLESKGPCLPASGYLGFPERRRETRYPTHDPVKVEIWQPPMLSVPATITNISRSGLRLSLPTRIGKGVQIKITLEHPMVIFGEVRYCRSFGDTFQAGVQIRDAVYVRENPENHVDDDALSFYLVGRGLTASEVIKLRDHLIRCESCRIRLGEKDAILNPVRRRKV